MNSDCTVAHNLLYLDGQSLRLSSNWWAAYETVCFDCLVKSTAASPTYNPYQLNGILLDLYCVVNPPTAISGGTATFSYDLYILDASPSLTHELDLGGDFTSTSSTSCPVSVFNADQPAEGYSVPVQFVYELTFDTAS